MGERGFTLVELLVVISIMTILTVLATVQFSAMQRKSAVEAQVRNVYGKLMEVRLEALYTKTPRAVLFSGKEMRIFSTDDVSGTPASVITLSFPMTTSSGANRVVYDASGIMTAAERSICVEPDSVAANPGYIDSLVVSAVRIYMGKRSSGGACVPASVSQK